MKAPFKKYIVFGYDDYYPRGGMLDVVGSADTIEEAKEIEKGLNDHTQIVDKDTWEVLLEVDRG